MIFATNWQEIFLHYQNLLETEEILTHRRNMTDLKPTSQAYWSCCITAYIASTWISPYMPFVKQSVDAGVSPNDNQFADLSGIPLSSSKNPFDAILEACDNHLVSLHSVTQRTKFWRSAHQISSRSSPVTKLTAKHAMLSERPGS